MKLPNSVEQIIEKLENAGYEAYAVGGCVRDSLLKRTPDDWDITTSALPDEVKKLFRRTIDTGIQHGTVTVLMREVYPLKDNEKEFANVGNSRNREPEEKAKEGELQFQGYEVTTYRIDGEYLDGRHPSKVSFTPSLHEDLARRDFTINAMAYNHRAGIVDDFEGMEDLKRGQIRAVGVAEHRFQEDALRMLRALRFSAQLSFSIEEETYDAVKKLAPNLKNVSKERIQVELSKLLLSDHPEYYQLIFESGLAPYITEHFSAIAKDQSYPSMPSGAPKKKYLRYGMLLRNLPEDAGKILKELKLDNETIKMGKSIAELHQEEIPKDEPACRKILSRYGVEIGQDWLKMEEALLFDVLYDEKKLSRENGIENTEIKDDSMSQDLNNGEKNLEKIEKIRNAEVLFTKILERGDCLQISELQINGQDLMKLGIEKGPKIGISLKAALDYVLEDPKRNENGTLQQFIKELFSENPC